jgi:LacI family transcriptional regulator
MIDYKPTLTDVAKLAGVSKMSASCVLNGSRSNTKVSEATRERIRRAAAELKYRPNAVARGLARGRMNTLGVLLMIEGVTPDIFSNFYAAGILQGVMMSANAGGYNVTLFSQPKAFVNDRRTDGLLLVAPPIDSPIVTDYAAEGIPLVTIAARAEDHGVPTVDVNNELGARLAMEHLLSLGHRRIAHLRGKEHQWDAQIRLGTFLGVLHEAGIATPPEYVMPTNFIKEWAYDATCKLLTLPEPPTAIFACNDALAKAAIIAARDEGVSVPEQLSVVGFDGEPSTWELGPPPTTVKQPLVQMGGLAANMLISRITGEEIPKETHLLAPELVVRWSTGPAP